MTPDSTSWSEGGDLPGDRGWLYGEGLFETVRLASGRPFRLDRHLQRLIASARIIGLPLPAAGWEQRVAAALAGLAPAAPAARARITVTAGPPDPAGDPAAPPRGPARLHVAVAPLSATPPLPPVTVALAGPPAPGRADALTAHKTLSYLANLLTLREARRLGADDGLVSAADGRLVGGARANLFLVQGERVLTPGPGAGPRPGVARQAVLEEIAPTLGLEPQEADLSPADLERAGEVFLTSSVRGVVPVAAVLGGHWSGMAPGPLTIEIQKAYELLVASGPGTG